MRSNNLIGIASGQIGAKKRIFVTEVRKTPFRNPKDIDRLRIYINPEIIWKSKSESTIYEGC
jgi:peptide deformylase